ncbi:hypothetical protein QJS04_geneDACA016265 [Acorus gramineus]|uniref:Uncharacterized protein n=1 Tax=Acorus gramineus TaxID=55184 RepID=A0AAV9AI38_ACOGR|nr:hypothetical protein QJS04_geneDACA016265 [Acorus gramineus]
MTSGLLKEWWVGIAKRRKSLHRPMDGVYEGQGEIGFDHLAFINNSASNFRSFGNSPSILRKTSNVEEQAYSMSQSQATSKPLVEISIDSHQNANAPPIANENANQATASDFTTITASEDSWDSWA